MSAGWIDLSTLERASRGVRWLTASLILLGCEQRLLDPPPPAAHREPAQAAPGAIGARPASADDGRASLLAQPFGLSPKEPGAEEGESEPEIDSDGGLDPAPPEPPSAHPAPPSPHRTAPSPPSNGVAL
jgi:hypothetical protein